MPDITAPDTFLLANRKWLPIDAKKNYTLLLLCLLGCLAACKTSEDRLPINHFQVIGSHNSYKQAIDPALFAMLSKKDSVGVLNIDYSHTSLSDQLNLGLRNLEIDIYADANGGKYAHPKGLELVKEQTPYPDKAGVMNEPGFKVMHIPDIDFRSNCRTFKQCLQQLKSWSAAHKNHYPAFITMNAKDDTTNEAGYTHPEKFTAALFNELDKTIEQELGRENLVTPDDVRGKYNTLEEAVISGAWPSLENARGKFIFILDETGEKLATYIQGHPSLRGRILFANAPTGTPEAAILIRNDPATDSIALLVKKGYIVRTRADADTREARLNDYSRFKAACQSGAQIITTDYYCKSAHFPSEYIIHFDGGGYQRINPLFLIK